MQYIRRGQGQRGKSRTDTSTHCWKPPTPPSPYPCLSPPRGSRSRSSESTITASSNPRTYPRVYSYTELSRVGWRMSKRSGGGGRSCDEDDNCVDDVDNSSRVVVVVNRVVGMGVCCDEVGVWRSNEKSKSKMSRKMRGRWKTAKAAVFHLRPIFQSFLTLFLRHFSKKMRLRNERKNGEKWLPWATLLYECNHQQTTPDTSHILSPWSDQTESDNYSGAIMTQASLHQRPVLGKGEIFFFFSHCWY